MTARRVKHRSASSCMNHRWLVDLLQRIITMHREMCPLFEREDRHMIMYLSTDPTTLVLRVSTDLVCAMILRDKDLNPLLLYPLNTFRR